MNDSEGDSFVDVDSDSSSSSDEIKPQRVENVSKNVSKSDSKLAARQRERELLEKMRQANAEVKDPVDLKPDEAYCEVCNLRISGDMNISVSYGVGLPIDTS